MTEQSLAHKFRTFGLGYERQALHNYLQNRLSLNSKDYESIISYLLTREIEVKGKDTFGVVYDITRICNLQCAHCCVNASLTHENSTDITFETTTEDALAILSKIHEYTLKKAFPNVFVIFGGGEPTLRPDFSPIVRFASGLFGQQSVGMNTNGTTLSVDELEELSAFMGFIEISIDGFRDYHNSWRDPHKQTIFPSPYDKTLGLVSEIIKNEKIASKLEVSSAVTTDNIYDLKNFAKYLADIGVQQYSVHRAMPVGRMGLRFNKVPSMEQYIHLLLDISWLRANTSLRSLHIHHSLESIYSTLFLGRDIHASDMLTGGSGRHSIGLDPQGNVYFDAWCVVPPFNQLIAGNILESETSLASIIEAEGSLIQLADDITKQSLRCRGCRMKCSGGMRFNGLAHFIFSRFGDKVSEAGITDLIAGMSEIDPACPLFER